jgi:hypothetical protein
MRGPLFERVYHLSGVPPRFGRKRTARNGRTKPLAKIFPRRLEWWCSQLSHKPYIRLHALTGPVYSNFMEPLLPELLEDVLLDFRPIVRRSFHAFRHGAIQYTNTVFPVRWSFFLACLLAPISSVDCFCLGDISDVYLSPLRDCSRARES